MASIPRDEAATKLRVEQVERLLVAYIQELPRSHPLRGARGTLAAHEFRDLLEAEVGQLDRGVFSQLCLALPPQGDPSRVDIREWLARLRAKPQFAPAQSKPDRAAALEVAAKSELLGARRELLYMIFAAASRRPGAAPSAHEVLSGPEAAAFAAHGAQALRRRLEAEDDRATGEVGVAHFARLLWEVGLGGEETMVLLRKALGGSTKVHYLQWLSECVPHAGIPRRTPIEPAPPPAPAPAPAPPPLPEPAPLPVLPEPPPPLAAPEAWRRDLWPFCRQLVLDIAAEAVTQAQQTGRDVMAAAQAMEERFELRPAVRAALSAEQRYCRNLPDPTTRGIALCCSLGRLLFLEKESTLRQMDLATGVQLDPLYLVSQAVPPPEGTSVPVMCIAVDDSLGHLAALFQENWTVCIWSMQPEGGGAEGGPIARRILLQDDACRKAQQIFEFRQYRALGFAARLLSFLEAPVRCYCLDMSWTGQLLLLDPLTLVTVRVIQLGGQPPTLGTGLSRAGLWAMCEKHASGSGGLGASCVVSDDVMAQYLAVLGVEEAEVVAGLVCGAGTQDCDFRDLCLQLDHWRYPSQNSRPRLQKAAAGRRDVLRTLARLLAERKSVDALLEMDTLEHRGILLGTSAGLDVVWVIQLVSGAVLDALRHRQADGTAAAVAADTLPPVIRAVASRDLLLTGGRGGGPIPACVNVWSLLAAPGSLPAAPARIFCPGGAAPSPVTGLDLLPGVHVVVDARSSGRIYLWDLARHVPQQGDEGGGGGGHSQPALILPHEPSEGQAPPASVIWLRPPSWSSACDTVFMMTAPLPVDQEPASLPSAFGWQGPASFSCWAVVRTRMRVPVHAMDLPSLPAMFESHIAERARTAFQRGAEDAQAAVRSRLSVALGRPKAIQHHASLARKAAEQSAPLRFTWTPHPLAADIRGLLNEMVAAVPAPAAPQSRERELELYIDSNVFSVCDFEQLAAKDAKKEDWSSHKDVLGLLRASCMERFWRAASASRLPVPELAKAVAAAGDFALVAVASGYAGPRPARPKPPAPPSFKGLEWSDTGAFGSRLQWHGGKWVAKVLRELRRVKTIYAHRQSIMLPLPPAKAVGYKSTTADCFSVFLAITASTAVPSHLGPDDFAALVRGTEAAKMPIPVAFDPNAQLRRLLARSAGAPSEDDVHAALMEVGVDGAVAHGFVQHLRSRGLAAGDLADAAADHLANALSIAGPADVRNAVGAVRGGEVLLATLADEAAHEWKGDAVRAATLQAFLLRAGILAYGDVLRKTMGTFGPAAHEPPLYSAGAVLRLLYGARDQVAVALSMQAARIQGEMARLDAGGTGLVDAVQLVRIIKDACGAAAALRFTTLPRRDGGFERRTIEAAILVPRSAAEVLQFVATCMPQAAIVRLLSLFCGGLCAPESGAAAAAPPLAVADARSRFGWAGLPNVRLATTPPRLFIRDAVDISDVRALVRTVAGLAVPEESLSLLSAALDPDGRGTISCTSFLKALQEQRIELVEQALRACAEVSAAGGEEPWGAGTLELETFLGEAGARFPAVPSSLWPVVAEVYSAEAAWVTGLPVKVDVARFVQDAVQRRLAAGPPPAGSDGGGGAPAAGSEAGGGGSPPEVPRDLLRTVHAARAAVLQACRNADTEMYGTLERDRFLAAVRSVGILLGKEEKEALADLADVRADGLVPYRLAMRKVALAVAAPAPPTAPPPAPAAGDGPPLPPARPPEVADFWRMVATALHDRCLALPAIFPETLHAPEDFGVLLSQEEFQEGIRRLGVTWGVSEGGSLGAAGVAGGDLRLPPALAPPAGEFRLQTSRDLAASAFQELDREGIGAVRLADIDARVRHARNEILGVQRPADAGVPQDLWARYISPDVAAHLEKEAELASIASAIITVVAGLEAHNMTPFQAFALLDAGRRGAVGQDELRSGLRALAPALTKGQADLLFATLRALPSGAVPAERKDGVTLKQFEQVFRPCLPAAGTTVRDISEASWVESIADRLVAFMGARDMSPEQLFSSFDVARRGRVPASALAGAAVEMRLGISPGEAHAFCMAAEAASGEPAGSGATYRGFIGVLRDAFARTRAKEPVRPQAVTPSRMLSGPELLDIVARKVHQLDPALNRAFRRFAVGGRMPRAALPDLARYLGLDLTRAQAWLLWKEMDPNNTGAVDERTWMDLFRVSISADVQWSSVFTRLDAACTAKGLPLEAALGDLDLEEAGTLGPAAARRIFGKLGVLASEREIAEWVQAVCTADVSGHVQVPIAHAAAVTSERAYGGRLRAAWRLQGRLQATGVSAEHALAIITGGSTVGFMTRGQLVQGLSSLGLLGSAWDLEQLLELLDPNCSDRIPTDSFLRAAAPDAAAARDALKAQGAELPRGSPSPAQLRAALLRAGRPGQQPSLAEVDLLVLALASEGNLSAGAQRSQVFRRILRAAKPAVQPPPRPPVDHGAMRTRADAFLLRLVNAVARDIVVLASVLPAGPPLLSLVQLNEALAPLGLYLGTEDATALRDAYPEDVLFNKEALMDVQVFLAIAQRFCASQVEAVEPEPVNPEEALRWLANKLRMRLLTTGLDLERSAVLGRPVGRHAEGGAIEAAPMGGVLVPAARLEEVLVSPPLRLGVEEARAIIYKFGGRHLDTDGKVNVSTLLSSVFAGTEPAHLGEEDLRWAEQIHKRLTDAFPGPQAAFEFLDYASQGALDAVHFCDGLLRLMSGSPPVLSDLNLGFQDPDALTLERLVGLAPRRYLPEAAHAASWNPAERAACQATCQRLFAGLARLQDVGAPRAVRLLRYHDFLRFWVQGPVAVGPAGPDPAPADVPPAGSVAGAADFWAAELPGIAAALGSPGKPCKLADLVPASPGLPDKAPGRELVHLVFRLLTLRFAPQLLHSSLRARPLVAASDPKEVALAPTLPSPHVDDLASPLLLELRRHSERIVHCLVRAPLDLSPPLAAGSADAALHWTVDRSRFLQYCEAAASARGQCLVGFSLQVDEQVANHCFRKACVYLYTFDCGQALALAASSIRPATRLQGYASIWAYRCIAHRLRQLRTMLADIQMVIFAHIAPTVQRIQLTALDCPPGAEQPPALVDAGRNIARHLRALEAMRLDDLRIDSDRPFTTGGLERQSFHATHPEVCFVTVEAVQRAVPHLIEGQARFAGPPFAVAFRVFGDERRGLKISEVLRGEALFGRALGWDLSRPCYVSGGELLNEVQMGDTLVFQGPGELKLVAEVVPRYEVGEVTVLEAALGALLSSRTGEDFQALLNPRERRAARAVAGACVAQFHGWWHRGDYVIAREAPSPGWQPLSEVVASNGALSARWFSGGIYIFKLLCRQILALLMLLHKHGVVARHLRLCDFLIAPDGLSLKLNMLQYATFMSSEAPLPSMRGMAADMLAPEYFAAAAGQATCLPSVDAWVFGALAYELFFGRPPPSFRRQLCRFLEAHRELSWSGSLAELPGHFRYTALAGVPPAFRLLLRAAMDDRSRHPAPPRAEAPLGPMLLAMGSVSAFVPRDATTAAPQSPAAARAAALAAGVWPQRLPEEVEDSEAEKEVEQKSLKEDMVVVPEGHFLDLIFGCLAADPAVRPALHDVFRSEAFDIETSEDASWQLKFLERLFEGFTQKWVRPTVSSKTGLLEAMLRLTCASLFKQGSLTEAQLKDAKMAMAEVESILLGPSAGAVQVAIEANYLCYCNFIAMRAMAPHPQLLQGFASTLSALLGALALPGSGLAPHADTILDLTICSLCGRELPLNSPAHWRTRFFLRAPGWDHKIGADAVDEMWRNSGQELWHFGTQAFLAFSTHYRYLLTAAAEARGPLAEVLTRRKVRGLRYLTALSEVAENHYRFGQANSSLARRSAVQQSRKVLRTRDPEQLLALADMRVPEAYLAMLGAADDCVAGEVLLFFEETEQLFMNPGEECQSGPDCPACSRFQVHRSARGVQLLTAVAMSPNIGVPLKKVAARLLLKAAAAYAQPPRRQAFAVLVQLLHLQRPRDDPITAEVQPYIRALLLDAVRAPTPSLVHCMYCAPSAFPLLGVSRADVTQPVSLEEVSAFAGAWLERAREGAQLPRPRPPNWLAVIPLLAWTRHLARLDSLLALRQAVRVLLEIYHEAAIQLELPCLPEPRSSGAPPADVWVLRGGPGARPPPQGPDCTSGPAHFMAEFVNLVELLFLRFGPAPAHVVLDSFLRELRDNRLVETAWYLQVLRLFLTLTARRAPWLQPDAAKDMQLRLQVVGIAAPPAAASGGSDDDFHPSRWGLARWHAELGRAGLGASLLAAFREVLAPARVQLRKPKWTVALFTLLRELWRNVLSGPAAPAEQPSVIQDMVDRGATNFIFGDCLGVLPEDAARRAVQLPPEVRGAGLALLGDFARRGLHHQALRQAVVSVVTRRMIEQLMEARRYALLPEDRAAAESILWALVDLKQPEVDALLQYVHVDTELPARRGPSAEDVDGGDDPEALSHPLALHRLQVGELVGGVRVDIAKVLAEVQAPAPVAPPPPAPAAAGEGERPRGLARPQSASRQGRTEVIMSRLRRSRSRPTG